jgi:hypothetical protein
MLLFEYTKGGFFMALYEAYKYMCDNDILEMSKEQLDSTGIMKVSMDLKDIIEAVKEDLALMGDVDTRIYFREYENVSVPCDYYLLSDIEELKRDGKTDKEINCGEGYVDTTLKHALKIFELVDSIT